MSTVVRHTASEWSAEMSPKEATDTVANVLKRTIPSIRIRSHLDNRVESEWLATDGRTAGILWWRRAWLGRVRYIVTASSVGSNSQVTLYVEFEERPNSNWTWRDGDPELAEKHTAKLRDAIYKALM
jgi:hypothetical protein